jgi:hypothetical protein
MRYIRKRNRGEKYVWEDEDYSNGIKTIYKKTWSIDEKYFTAVWWNKGKLILQKRFLSKLEAFNFLNKLYLEGRVNNES